jgi:hypothetical protein
MMVNVEDVEVAVGADVVVDAADDDTTHGASHAVEVVRFFEDGVEPRDDAVEIEDVTAGVEVAMGTERFIADAALLHL